MLQVADLTEKINELVSYAYRISLNSHTQQDLSSVWQKFEGG